MREEIKNTWIQSTEDLKTAELNIEIDRFYASVFFSQQAAEKALKSLYIHQKGRLPKTHNLVDLATDLKAPDEVIEDPQVDTPATDMVLDEPAPIVQEPEPLVEEPEPVVQEPEPLVQEYDPLANEPGTLEPLGDREAEG